VWSDQRAADERSIFCVGRTREVAPDRGLSIARTSRAVLEGPAPDGPEPASIRRTLGVNGRAREWSA